MKFITLWVSKNEQILLSPWAKNFEHENSSGTKRTQSCVSVKPLASLEVVGWLRYCYLIRKNWNTTLFCNFWPQMTLTQVWCQELQFDIWFSLFASSLRFDPKLPQICSLTFRKFSVLPFSPFRKILGAHYLIDAFYLITIPVF